MANILSINGDKGDQGDKRENLCPICHKESICDGLGMVRYAVPMDDPRFGKMFRCPNNPPEVDTAWQDRLRDLSNLGAYVDKSFDNFVTNYHAHSPAEQEALRFAHDSAMRFSESPDGWVLFEGSYGCGKTHLAAAIANYRIEQGDAVLFITAPDLLDHLRSAYGPTSEVGYDEMFERIRSAPLLIVDDLGVENPSAWAQEKLFQLLNHRYTHKIPTVITTNADVDRMDGRIRSRLLDISLIRRIPMRAPDFRNLDNSEKTPLEVDWRHYVEMRFDTFDIQNYSTRDEQSNLQRVVKATYEYAENPHGWMLLTGGPGTGKTHLAAAIANVCRGRGESVMFLSMASLLDYLRTSFSREVSVGFTQRFHELRETNLLILEDLNNENTSAWAKEKILQLLDHRYVARLSTVMTTSAPIEKLDDRLRVRVLDDRLCRIFAITTRAYSDRRRQYR